MARQPKVRLRRCWWSVARRSQPPPATTTIAVAVAITVVVAVTPAVAITAIVATVVTVAATVRSTCRPPAVDRFIGLIVFVEAACEIGELVRQRELPTEGRTDDGRR